MTWLSPFHSRRVEAVPPRDSQQLQYLIVEVVDHDPVDLLRNVDRNAAPSVTTQLRHGCLLAMAYFVALHCTVVVLLKIALSSGWMLLTAMFLIILFMTRVTLVQSWSVSSFLILHVGLEILRNAVSCSGLKINQELSGHNSAIVLLPVLFINKLHSLWVLYTSWEWTIVQQPDVSGGVTLLFVINERGNVGFPSRFGSTDDFLFSLRKHS